MNDSESLQLVDSPERVVGLMTIGAIARATRIPANTLRTWERRYGFPTPARADNNQRLYDAAVVPHLVLVAHALARGHRPRQIMSLGVEELKRLVGSRPPPAEVGSDWLVDDWIDATCRLDGLSLERGFRSEYARLGALRFLEERAVPFLTAVGESWRRRELDVFQEHFASERLRAFLSSLWSQMADRAQGSAVVCATLPGEQHDLGLHLAATVLAMRHKRVIFLGANNPVQDIERGVLVSRASAALVSISPFSVPSETRSYLLSLRARLPNDVDLLLGGGGAPLDLPGVRTLGSLGELSAWADETP